MLVSVIVRERERKIENQSRVCVRVRELEIEWRERVRENAHLEEYKEEGLHEPVHGSTNEHHDEEEHDLEVGEDELDPLHAVLVAR